MSSPPESPATPTLPPTGPGADAVGTTPPGPPHGAVHRRSGRTGLYVAVGVIIVVAIVVGAGYGTHWYGLAPAAKSTPPGDCPTGVTIAGAGASFLTALLSNWEASYATYSGNTVTYNPVGAGTGIGDFETGTVNFAATDEPLTGAQIKAEPGTTLTLPVSGGAVTIVYHIPGFTGTLELNGTQLADIYLGTVTTWDNAFLTANNPGLSTITSTIIPVVRSDVAGTTYVLTNYLSDDDTTFAHDVGISIQPTWPTVSGEEAEKGNSGLAEYVAATDSTIGYVDLADAQKYDNTTSSGIGIAEMGNPAKGYVYPNVADTQAAIDALETQTMPASSGNWSAVTWVNAPNAGDYPLATLQYFLILENPATGLNPSVANTQVLVQWIQWAITTGQSATAKLDYAVPPTAWLDEASHALTSSVNYNGASIPACTTVG